MKYFPDFVERLILERIRFEYMTEIPIDVLANLTIEQIINLETKAVRMFFKTFIPGREVRTETVKSVTVYTSWWQHFKAACFPGFLKRFFPVRSYSQPVVIRHLHLCPHTGAGADTNQKEFCFGFLKELEIWGEDNQFGRGNDR